MIVEKLVKKDAKDIAEFFTQNFADGWTEEMINSGFNLERLNAFGVKDNERIIGVITYSIAGDTADIEDVVVDKNYRRKGVATSLVNAVIESVKQKNATKLFLEVREKNQGAIAFYKTQNFVEINRRKNYYPDGENAIVMVKEF
ncbi:MAG: ribosomal protein S18-alanine N-acetyltransferase [Clostridia bacterium]|nr:ribosomal protein S18-alanine N-acetyltransferase [Clostridia bacterium]